MLKTSIPVALLVCAFGFSLSAQAQQPSTPGSGLVKLRYATFDPLAGEPAVPADLKCDGAEELWIVQFVGTPTQGGRDAVTSRGGQIHGYLPDNSYVVRMSDAVATRVDAVSRVRWVGRYHAAYRLDPELIGVLGSDQLEKARYNIVVVDKRNDKPALIADITALGGEVVDTHEGGLLLTADFTEPQLIGAAKLDQILWIDKWSPPETDVDNARIQGGANFVEAQAGYSGSNMGVHIYEGVDAGHPGFSGPVTNVNSGGASSGHGTNTAGIVFGDGTGNPQYRGFAPDCSKYYTNYSSVSGSRWGVCNALVNTYNVSHTTASWGNARTFFYTSVSADADDIIFDHDIAWTQSQSNAGNQDSRPQAWAKNIFSIGGFAHYNNSNPGDDSWAGGNGSTGPAADGRIKPTLAAYYDSIGTTSSGGGYTGSFGGTSGATPIVAGHNCLAIEMFTDDSGTPGVGPFGNPLRSPGSSIHVNRPHFTTLKALQVASATQYSFNSGSSNNRREHVGWGYPSLQTMWNLRNKTFLIDETEILTQGQTHSWDVAVAAGESAFRAVLNYSEPSANPSAAITLINNLSLRVTSPGGTVYWGNNGLEDGNWSVVGGSEDGINPIECVFVANPQVGTWTVDIIATSIVSDNHVETGAVDADYGLVVTGGTGGASTAATFATYGAGCPGSTSVTSPCVESNGTGGVLTGVTDNREYCFVVQNASSMQVTSFDIYSQSTGGTQVRPAHIYQSLTLPPLASTTVAIGSTPGFYRATLASPVWVSGAFFIAVDLSSQNVYVPTLTSGSTGVTFARPPTGGTWSYVASADKPSWSVNCTAGTVFDVPTLGNLGMPVLGTTYNVTLSYALPSAPTFIITGFSDSIYNGQVLPFELPDAPGCDLLASAESTALVFATAVGTAITPISVPSGVSFIGVELFHQWAALDIAANALGLVLSDAGWATIGT